jgi:hypothetical protein
MTYYVLASVKSDLGITNTDYDSIIGVLGVDSDSEVDEEIRIAVSRVKKASLPDLPLTTVPQTIIEASNSLVKSKFFGRPDGFRPEMAKLYYDTFKRKINLYVLNIKDTSDIGGEIF